MAFKGPFIALLLLVLQWTTYESAWAKFTIHFQTAVAIELIGYDGLANIFLFKGSVPSEGKQEIDTPYRGLALLIFEGGQSYPVIIGDEPFTLKITDPAEPPSFADSRGNDFFYKRLSGNPTGTQQFPFPLLMIQAKKLLKSSHSIHTIKELTAKKKEFHEFVSINYESLKHSDMVRRFIGQYFMVHEYVDYHIEGTPATDIRVKYQKEILDGVRNWLEILKPHIPEYEILNYCVSLYYNRSMVSLASLIIENFKDVAYCPGDEKEAFSFPGNLFITEANSNRERKLGDLKGDKFITFASDDCPVSMVESVVQARQAADLKTDTVVIVAPLQKLSEKHLAISRMVSCGKMFFIDDEKWRKENLPKTMRLPFFQTIKALSD